ncbi:MAG: MFS transporter [Desulfobulbus sp.]|jgi:FSR family fosmidomycin resistance protein-like MFS transporter|uniref:MFS transporter n=1 Tax=Desulfobulbus sp. TaxID=895 RepID=UPI00283B37DC|nr:MFS transporter [Desulfobulbus sp.]MDR2549867.1 MFS transporter [Desulfobulbus sp.]
MAQQSTLGPAAARPERIALKVLVAISISHFLNDLIQSLIPAIYPLLKDGFQLSFTQIGLITLTFQMSASLLQPLVGLYTDRHPQPYSLPWGMGCTLIGLVALAFVPTYGLLLLAVALVGTGSAVLHPESSRVARMASAGHYGLAQSIFQVGGNGGTSAGPLLAALIVIPYGRSSLAWFSLIAFLAMVILWRVGTWYAHKQRQGRRSQSVAPVAKAQGGLAAAWPVLVLLVLMFSKFFYISSLNSYLTFYLMGKFQVSMQAAQLHLFVFLFGMALGTMIGGPIGDRIGRKQVIWWSIFGAAPFALALPYASLFWTGPLTFIIGLLMSSAFPAILVYAQELFPGKVGMISGLFFGLAFGLGGIGAALVGRLADTHGIEAVYRLCSWLPLLGLAAVLLPNSRRHAAAA